MRAPTTRLRLGLIAGLAGLALVAAACGDDDDDGGTATTAEGGTGTTAAGGGDLAGKTVNISGSETGAEADGFTGAFGAWEARTGAKINFTGTRDFETQIRVAAEGGSLPDIALFPQPGLAKQLAEFAAPLNDKVVEQLKAEYDQYWTDLMTVDGKPLGVPIKADLKSLVWYSPPVFEEKGYEIPETWDDLMALQDKIKEDGGTPWCVGIESGDATGWPFTDWMEDVMLRMHGPDVYDQWVSNEMKFDDPKVKEVAEMIGEIWFTEGNVLGGRESIASTGFANAGLPVLDGSCLMHRQANFYSAQFKDKQPDVVFGPEGDINVFYLPTMSDEFGKVTLSAGLYAVAFNDKPETQSAMEYLATAEYSNERIKQDKGGFLSPNKNTDVALYSSELDKVMQGILSEASPVRFDASDLMPGEVGAGAFWKEGTNYVNGTRTVDEFLKNTQAAWPSS